MDSTAENLTKSSYLKGKNKHSFTLSKKKVLMEIFDLNRRSEKRILIILLGENGRVKNCNKYY